MTPLRRTFDFRWLRGIAVSGLLVSVGALSLGAQPDAKSIIERIETPQVPDRGGFDGLSIPQLMQRLRVPGVSIAVIRDFRVHWVKTYGVADVETRRPVDSATTFQAASISKPVTALGAMRLAQEQPISA